MSLVWVEKKKGRVAVDDVSSFSLVLIKQKITKPLNKKPPKKKYKLCN